jgi:hypothetical protein
VTLDITPQTCNVEPFRYQATPQPVGDQGASASQINEQQIEDYLNRIRVAICDDLRAIIAAAGGSTPTINRFIQLLDVPNNYVGDGGLAVAVKSDETGLEFVPFPSFDSSDLEKWISYSFAVVAGTPLQTIGNGGGGSSPTSTTTAPALSTASISASIYRIKYVTVNNVNQICWVILSALLITIGPSADIGGFRWRARGGIDSAIANQRCYFGLRGVTTNPTSADPSAQTNIIGFGCDAGDTTLSVMHNDAAGAATEIPLGANFPATTAGELYDFELTCEPGSGTVDYSITRLNTGDVATGTLSTNLPATTQFLCGVLWVATAGTAGVASLFFVNQYFSRF